MRKSLFYRPFTLFGMLVTVFICFTACSKKSTPAPPAKTKTQLLTAHDWTETKAEFGSSASSLTQMTIGGTPLGFRFTSTADDTGTFISGAGNGTWTMINSETQMQLNITADSTHGINASTVTVAITFAGDGSIQLLYPNGNYGYVDSQGTAHYYAVQRLTFGPM